MEPVILDYGPSVSRPWILRWRWVWASILILGVAVGFVFTRSGNWSNTDACSLCSAVRTREGLRLFGWQVEISDQVDLGVAGRSLQKHDGKPCVHAWQMADISSPAIRASGYGLAPASANSFLSIPYMENVLDAHLKSDPTFAAELRRYIQSYEKFSPWVQSLYAEAEALRKKAATPSVP